MDERTRSEVIMDLAIDDILERSIIPKTKNEYFPKTRLHENQKHS